MRKFIFLMVLLCTAQAFAQITPIRNSEELDLRFFQKDEKLLWVKTGSIIVQDDALLIRDLPFLRLLTKEERTVWLNENVRVISSHQLENSATQTPVDAMAFEDRPNSFPKFARVTKAYRPKGYGRGLVLVVEDKTMRRQIALLDVKGVGSLKPKLQDHENGLMALGEALREFLVEKLVNKVLHHARAAFTTVGTYAAGDYQFSLREPLKFDPSEPLRKNAVQEQRAGFVVRQASTRYLKKENGDWMYAPTGTSWAVEKILRAYGITSAGSDNHGNKNADGLNIQLTGDLAGVIDFGGFLVKEKFLKPIYEFVDAFYLAQGEEWRKSKVVSSPLDRNFIQPEAKKVPHLELWGTTRSGVESPRFDNIMINSEDMFRDRPLEEPIPKSWIENHIVAYLNSLSKYDEPPTTCDGIFSKTP